MELTINGKKHRFDVESDVPLLWLIREELGMTGTKFGCGIAQCGACTVLIDGKPARSCVIPASAVATLPITTIEAIQADPVGRKVVQAWVSVQVPQCGYCQSGQVMAATALLKQKPKPTEADIISSMTNICRCGTYNDIVVAVQKAAQA